MAIVYLAEQKSLNRRVAFKVLKTKYAADENYVRRFRNEAQAAAALVHANIVQIYEVGCIEGIHFIAQEYVAGQTLKQLLSRGGLGLTTAIQIIRQVALALHKSSGQGIVHRDIKPENILLGGESMVKVADFGLARFGDARRTLDLTEVGVTLGTPLYMSPEQVEGQDIDVRSDFYSFGVTAYHMLAGQPPFDGDTPLNVAVKHLKSEPTPLEEFRKDLPTELCSIIHKLMAKQPEDRYQSLGEMLNELRSVPAPGLSDEWSTGMELWDVPSEPTVPSARFAETQRLSLALETSGGTRESPLSSRRLWWASGMALLFGAALAWATRPADPWAGQSLPAVDKQETASAQYTYALTVNEDRALRAVFEYFPPDSLPPDQDRYFSLRAKKDLARRYLENREYELAVPLLQDLVALEEGEAKFRAFGFAGQAFIYQQLGLIEVADGHRTEARKLDRHLDDDDRQLFRRAASQGRRD